MNIKTFIGCCIFIFYSSVCCVSPLEQQLIDAINAKNVSAVINLSKQKVKINQSTMINLMLTLGLFESSLCSWLIIYNSCYDVQYFVGLHKQIDLKVQSKILNGRDEYDLNRRVDDIRHDLLCIKQRFSLNEELQLTGLEQTLTEAYNKYHDQLSWANMDFVATLEKIENAQSNKQSPSEQGKAPLLQNSEANTNELKVVESNIHISLPTQQQTFYQKHNWLLVPIGVVTAFGTYFYQFHSLKKVERMLDDQIRWMNWQVISDKDLLTIPKDEFIKKLKFSIFMTYKSIKEIANPSLALDHFVRDITYEIKQLKYYIARAQRLSSYGLSTAFGIHDKVIQEAEEKLKKVYYLKDTFMEWAADKKLKKYAPHGYTPLPIYAGT